MMRLSGYNGEDEKIIGRMIEELSEHVIIIVNKGYDHNSLRSVPMCDQDLFW